MKNLSDLIGKKVSVYSFCYDGGLRDLRGHWYLEDFDTEMNCFILKNSKTGSFWVVNTNQVCLLMKQEINEVKYYE